MTFMEFLVATLATWQAVEIWHHGSNFAGLRARAELMDNRLGYLLLCMFCLSNWVAYVVALLVLSARLDPAFGWLVALPVYALAVARAANLGNDLTARWCRTPKPDKMFGPDDSNTTFKQKET